jgi:hypothetical protein
MCLNLWGKGTRGQLVSQRISKPYFQTPRIFSLKYCGKLGIAVLLQPDLKELDTIFLLSSVG